MITETTVKQNISLSSELKNIFNKYTSTIPDYLDGPERADWIIDNYSQVTIEHRQALLELIRQMLSIMVDREASDIEVGGYGADGNVWFRVYGKKEPVPEIPSFTDDEAAILILAIFNEKQRNVLRDIRNLDFSFTYNYNDHMLRFRGDAFFDVDRLAINMRSIVPQLRSVEELGFPQKVLKALSYTYIKQGLILITGITGSGKSTTLDAIVSWHNHNCNAHIVTIASPLEYVHKSKKCIIRQREVGRDVRSFHEGVVQALRQDLDIMVIGEMRDPQTILAALEVSDTGHKVFSTLHTSSAVESIDRIVAEVEVNEQERVRNRLADVLTAVISQKLLPGLDGKLVLAKEILIVNPSVKAAIKNNNTSEINMMINSGGAQGMITIEQDLVQLYHQNKISLETALQYANNKELFKELIGASV
jgi:twitching motility protein PilT